MKKNLIKYKITLWYTLILTAVLILAMGSTLIFTEFYFVKEAKAELSDEVDDFYKEVRKIRDLSAESDDRNERKADPLYGAAFPDADSFYSVYRLPNASESAASDF